VSQLLAQLGDRVFAGIAVDTKVSGVRVPDVAWLPAARWHEAIGDRPLQNIPPLVLEVLSPRNHRAEVAHKVKAYLAAGATEVIVIDGRGNVSHLHANGDHTASVMGVSLRPPAEMFV
jgi:Uma2 family endonuclease